MKLSDMSCNSIKIGTAPLSREETESLLPQVPTWTLKENALEREFRFRDFRQAMEFVNRTAALANDQDHHPDIFISYNKVKLNLSTHKIGGLSINDFIVAAKIDFMTDQRLRERAA